MFLDQRLRGLNAAQKNLLYGFVYVVLQIYIYIYKILKLGDIKFDNNSYLNMKS